MKEAEFKNSAGVINGIVGVLIIAVACVGLVMVAVLAPRYDLQTVGLALLGFAGASTLGAGFVNSWRTPLLTVRPDALIIPAFLGKREIPITADHPLGEYLASSHKSSRSKGTIEASKFVHFITLDAAGTLTEVVSMHRDAPQIPTFAGLSRRLQD